MSKFLEIKNKTETRAELFIYGDIVSNEWMRWDDEDQCPLSVKTALDEIKDVKNLDIFINSGGGSVFAGMAIYNMLKRNSAFKTVFVDGVAASISSVIALAGDKIVIPKNAYFMIHKASAFAWGDSNEFKRMVNLLETVEKGILNVYEENLKQGVNIDEIKELMEKETWFTGDEAAEYFNVEVSEEVQAVATTSDLTNFKNIPQFLKDKDEKIVNVSTKGSITEEEIDKIVSKIVKTIGKETEEPKKAKVLNFNELRKKLINI